MIVGQQEAYRDELDGFEHGGWTLRVELERGDGKPHRLAYFADKPGHRIPLDWSPYQRYRRDHFARMVDLGFPTGRGATALFPDDIEELV